MSLKTRLLKEARKLEQRASQSQSSRAQRGRKPSAKTRRLQRQASSLRKVAKSLRRF